MFGGTGPVSFASGNNLVFTAAGTITFNGDEYISISAFKTLVASATDFADFQAKTALL